MCYVNNKAQEVYLKNYSEAWLHFTKVVDTEDPGAVKAMCKCCRKLLKADPKRNGTSRLRRHITEVYKMGLLA